MKKLSLATQIMIGLILGIGAGMLLTNSPDIATTYIQPIGTIFLNLIKMIVVPIVLFSIISGIISLSDIKKVGIIGVKTIMFYMCTTAIAISLGLFVSNQFDLGGSGVFEVSGLEYTASEAPSFIQTLVGIFPSNIVTPLYNAEMLQIIVIAILFGFGIILAGEKGKVLGELSNSISEVSIQIMGMIVKLSPVGVFALIAPVVAVNGPNILGSLFRLILVVYVTYTIHAVVVYSLSARLIVGLSPLTFFKGMAPAIMMGFSSASSVGTLPINMECAEKLGAKKRLLLSYCPLAQRLIWMEQQYIKGVVQCSLHRCMVLI